MSNRRQWSTRLRRLLAWVGTATLAALPGWGQSDDEPGLPPFRLHPLSQQAPVFTAAPDPVGPQTAPDPGADPRAAQLTRWLREQVAQRPPVVAVAPRDADPRRPASQQEALTRLQQQSGGQVQVRFRPNNGTPSLIKGRPLERRSARIAKAGADLDEVTARSFLRSNAALLRLEDPDQELQLVTREQDELGHGHLRFRQMFQGLPVWPCELKVHLDAEGSVYLLDGAFVPTPSGVATAPTLTGEQAVEAARLGTDGGAQAEATPPELVIYAPLNRPARLAWKFDLLVGIAEAWRCLMDAENGSELARIDLCPHGAATGSGADGLGNNRPLALWQEGNTYYMVDTSKPMFDRASAPPNNARGVIIVADARNQPPSGEDRVIEANLTNITFFHVTSASANSGWVPDAVGAAFGLSQTYDYYLQRHNRNSLNGRGGSIIGIVRLGVNFPNAFWTDHLGKMFFGDGYTRAVDVCGHELTHGVISSLGNGGILNYHFQPGALNEAFADIFGEMVEAFTRSSRPDWLKGAELSAPFPVQDYANPNARSQLGGRPNPAKMSQFFELPLETDRGGVHINSSIINHCFYLLAEGLPGAIGLRDAERIFYRALTVHLDKESQFIDARHACVNAAEALFGASSPQVRKTAEAFDAVEIFDAPSTPEPSPIPTVQSPDATLALRLDPQASQYVLVRRETARGDPATGTFINTIKYLAPKRVSVTGDGARAWYVASDNDLGLVETDGTNPRVAGLPGLVHSLAAAPDGTRYALVLLDQAGRPTKTIRLVDLAAGTERNIQLYAPGTEGAKLDIIQFADVMDFTADGQTLIFDAYAEIKGVGGQLFGGWTLYKLDLRTDAITALIDLDQGLDFGNPSLGHTRNHLLTFEVVNRATGISTIYAADLSSNDAKALATINPPNGLGVPGYTGDDRAIIYAQGDNSAPSGFSLLRQPLAADGITPTGQPAVWMRDADVGVIYRRGQFVSSNRPPTTTITSPTKGQTFNAPATITIQATADDSDGGVARVEFYQGSTKLGEVTTAPYSFIWNNVPAGNYRLFARALDNLGAAGDSTPVEIRVQSLTAKPDLMSPNLDVAPSPAVEGQTITLTATVKNTGQTSAPTSRARAFLSPANDFNTQDDFAFPTTVSVPALAPDQEFQAVWTAPMPDLGSGTYDYWPLVLVDSDNAVDEVNENNLWKRNQPLQARDPDGQPPQITAPPQNLTVSEGQTATLGAQVTGNPAPTLQWQRSTDGGATWTELSDGNGISGSRTSTLTLAGVTSAQNGHRFRLRAVNSAGEAVSTAAVLTVTPTQAPRHPADVNPPDNRLTLQEVIAYAAAYKHGQVWPEGPNPIPLDYMIRAATLYKRGETYRHDPNAGGPPLWWENVPVP